MYIYDIYYIWNTHIYIHVLYRFSNALYYLISNFPRNQPSFSTILFKVDPDGASTDFTYGDTGVRIFVQGDDGGKVVTIRGGTPVRFVGFGFGGWSFLGWFVEEVSDEKWKKKGPGKLFSRVFFWGWNPTQLYGEYIILLNKSDGELFSLANISYSERSYVETTQ